MSSDLDFMSDEDWAAFQNEMLRLVSRGHLIPNVPADPADTVQSAIATFLRRRLTGGKREAGANSPEAVRLVLLYRAWRKLREHRRRRKYVTNRASNFTSLDPAGGLERVLKGTDDDQAEIELFIREALEQVDNLPDQERAVVRLCMDGYSSREIAGRLGIPVAAIVGTLAKIKISLTGDASF